MRPSVRSRRRPIRSCNPGNAAESFFTPAVAYRSGFGQPDKAWFTKGAEFGEVPIERFAIRVGFGEVPTERFAIRLGSGEVPTGGFVMAGGWGRANGGVGGFQSS